VAENEGLDRVGQTGASKSRTQAQISSVRPTKRCGTAVGPSGGQAPFWKVATIPDLLGEQQLRTCARLHAAEVVDDLTTGGQRIVSPLAGQQPPGVALT